MVELEEFDYYLPRELIAQEPIRPRDSSKLMVIKKKEIEHRSFREIYNFLEKDDVLVLNNTKVLPNRLVGEKSTGSKAEIIIEEKEENLYRARVVFRGKKLGAVLNFPDGLVAKVKHRKNDIFWLEFNKSPEETLEKWGKMPIPYYVKKPIQDQSLYQTEFASDNGSLAAPTSGFHFTGELLGKIKDIGVKIVYVTLHISFGTFSDIKGPVEKHKMEKESYIVPQETAVAINNRKNRLIVCGTTSFKAIESASDSSGLVHPNASRSGLFIYPGYKFRIKPDMMITNFHLPKSTLILFVSAYFGKDVVLNAYNEAVKEKYRFFSFGDATLFYR